MDRADYMDRASPANRASLAQRDNLILQLHVYQTSPASRSAD